MLLIFVETQLPLTYSNMKPNVKIFKHPTGETQANLAGELTVKYATEVSLCLEKVMNEERLTLVIDEPASVDLSLLQLVYSLKKTREAKGLPLTLRTNVSTNDHSLLARTGFASFLNLLTTKDS